MSFMDFSSWPRDQEQTFVVYEQRAAESQKKAFMFGAITAAAVFVIALGIYAGVEPDHKDLSKDMNMSNLTKKDTKKAAPAPTPDPAPAAVAPAPAPTPAPAAPAPSK
jgi:hypothetical protein